MPSPLIPLPPRNTKDGDKRAGEGLVEFCTKESRPTPPYFQADATAGSTFTHSSHSVFTRAFAATITSAPNRFGSDTSVAPNLAPVRSPD